MICVTIFAVVTTYSHLQFMLESIFVFWLLSSCWQVVGEYGMAHFSDKGKSKGKDYCIFFNPQWAHLPQDLNKAVSQEWSTKFNLL